MQKTAKFLYKLIQAVATTLQAISKSTHDLAKTHDCTGRIKVQICYVQLKLRRMRSVVSPRGYARPDVNVTVSVMSF